MLGEGAGFGHGEMGADRGRIGPALEEVQLQRVLGIDIDAVLETAGLGAGAADVFEAEPQHLGAVRRGGDDMAGDDDHGSSSMAGRKSLRHFRVSAPATMNAPSPR